MATQSAVACPSCRAEIAPGARFCGACGRTISGSAPASIDDIVGRTLGGRYRVLSKLGAGGMGTVFRAEQTSVKRTIALKVLDPAMTMNPELLRRFQAEAEVVARLSHPNTVTLFDFGQDETGLLFIAMELVQGATLRDTLARDGALTPYRAVDIAEQVASSLADAHGHGIVHRDLKPDNVILSERAGRRDFARVLDFGIAKLFDDPSAQGPAMTRAGQILGTPQYMAPEQIVGHAIDQRTDVYALGVMLYEMLTGVPPFRGDNMVALMSAHLHDTAAPLGSARPGLVVPMPLDRLVFSCLAKEPKGRPPDMKTVAAELADLRSLLDPGPRRPSAIGSAVATPPPLPLPFTPPPLPFTPPPPPLPQPFTPPPLPPPLPLASPAVATPPPLPFATPPLPTPMGLSAPLAAAPRARRPWMAPALLVVVAGAIGAGVYGVTKLDRGGGDDGDDPAPGPPPSGPVATGPGETITSSQLGFSITLPPGLSGREDAATGGVLAQGSYDGMVLSIAVSPVQGDGDLESRASQISQLTGGAASIVERRERRVRGAAVVSIVYDVASAGSRFETVFYPGEPSLAVTFAAPQGGFDDTAALRDALFREKFDQGLNR